VCDYEAVHLLLQLVRHEIQDVQAFRRHLVRRDRLQILGAELQAVDQIALPHVVDVILALLRDVEPHPLRPDHPAHGRVVIVEHPRDDPLVNQHQQRVLPDPSLPLLRGQRALRILADEVEQLEVVVGPLLLLVLLRRPLPLLLGLRPLLLLAVLLAAHDGGGGLPVAVDKLGD